MNRLSLSLVLWLVLFVPQWGWAGGAVARPKQIKAQRQQMQEKQQIMYQQQMQQQERAKAAAREPVDESEVQEVVDLPRLLATFETSSEAWPLIIDNEAKETVVAHYIAEFQKQGIAIQNPPALYVNAIDTMSGGDTAMLKQPFPNILRVVAIVEYDFNNGQDKDKMALQILGEKSFKTNKERLLRRR
ncbi:MAG: hypothetical protein A2787_00555 [Omnitrophica WOR_2 bacterium RIFCSPHIGHO2_01_FULL_48_9]|nr:MAG: hypothetical protein A3D10_00030 [Omnitrophica WOR_2 bacterium RIFCSPHIGHO2_02_FULL_48_11]OGX33623.1 MAG: hypothetical protein A2787_00555 [Omnitrophica WOR_2 bacterium RIFCSPHIGHO2_01_FULL_48_9]